MSGYPINGFCTVYNNNSLRKPDVSFITDLFCISGVRRESGPCGGLYSAREGDPAPGGLDGRDAPVAKRGQQGGRRRRARPGHVGRRRRLQLSRHQRVRHARRLFQGTGEYITMYVVRLASPAF